MSGQVVFDASVLKGDHEQWRDLTTLYCDIFSLDPNFGEYRQCPICSRYFNYQQVEVDGVCTCDDGHAEVELQLAWDVEKVMGEILEQASEPGFFGVVTYQGGALVGFAWSRVISFDEVRKHWGDAIVDQVQPLSSKSNLFYFDELGVGLQARNQGLGREMVEFICRWAKTELPGTLGLLRTHSASPARGIFEAMGFEIFASDTEFGGGRVMMKIDDCLHLRV